MKSVLKLVYAPCNEIEVIHVQTGYAPNDYVYMVPEKESSLIWFRNLYQAEKEKNDWIRKYDRLLKGLNYWKARAEEK